MQIRCNYCRQYFDTDEKDFAYCPNCENDNVEITI